MKRFLCIVLVSLLSASAALAQKPREQSLSSQLPRVFLLDAQGLHEARERIRKGDKSFDAALAKLEREAKKALDAEIFTVTAKPITPPSGDKHDYYTQAPYWWPNPAKPNGLPYIRRDGEHNPEVDRLPDHGSQDKMISTVRTLAAAYYFKGDEKYADKAAKLLRAWFLDAETRMNPNLRYAQYIPGLNDGRGTGLIETRALAELVDAIGLLAGSKAWTENDQRGLQTWFDQFLKWMLESKNGRDEATALNNHGTYYDVQTASFALFAGKKGVARQILQNAQKKRIAKQIEPDGRQPLELERTRSWNYSVMNLHGLVSLAQLGEQSGVDLWAYQTPDGRGIRKAIEYLAPFAFGEQKWPYQQIVTFSPDEFFSLMRMAAAKYHDEKFRALAAKLPTADPADRDRLFY